MKALKKIALLLCLVMLVAMLGGCFSITKKTTAGNDSTTTETPEQTTEAAETTTDGGNEQTEPEETYSDGYELTAFLDGYTDAKGPVFEAMSNAVNEGSDFQAVGALLGMTFADMMILDVYFFDSVNELGGMIMFTAIDNAYKNIKGDVVEFGYDYTYPADKADDMYPAGSHLTCTGNYNMKTGHIIKESVDDKGDGNVTRTVIEINKIAADSYISQFITADET